VPEYLGEGACPKCGGFLKYESEERYCLNCGWVPTYDALGNEEDTTEYTTASGMIVERKARSARVQRVIEPAQLFRVQGINDPTCQAKYYETSRKVLMKDCSAKAQFLIEVRVEGPTIEAQVCARHLHYWERRARVTIIKEV